ncbi:MAG: IS1 family transposase [Candidatus Omnitrophota bacterium]|nr:IS1 family transposase [Candidatus Omnitrophota bacterium]
MSFCYAKEKNVPKKKQGKFSYGNVWTWTAICADTKLVPCWLVAERNLTTTQAFMGDLANRLKHRVQITTDGHKTYLEAIEGAFGSEVDYFMFVKIYGNEPQLQDVRYSPAVCLAAQGVRIQDNPDPKHVSTSFAERQNLTMRMQMRRFTRLTNAFSKKVQNLKAAVAPHFMHYNFVRIHKTLRVTPAMAAGVTKKLWELEDILDLVEQTIYRAN